MKIEFTEAQKQELQRLGRVKAEVDSRFNDFLNYLISEYKADDTCKMSQDLTGFIKPDPVA